MEGAAPSGSLPPPIAGMAASPPVSTAPSGILLDCRSRRISAGQSAGHLRRLSARILSYLARRDCQPVTARELAVGLDLKSRVDVVAAARQAVGALRADLRALGLGDVVLSRRGVGYVLAKPVLVVADEVTPDPPAPWRGGQAGSRAGLTGRGRPAPAAVSQNLDVAKPLLCALGIVDVAARCFWLAGRRLLTRSERDFRLLERLVSQAGAAVEERDLMQLCGYRPDRSGPELLRRASRRLNQRLILEGIPWRIRPTAPALGSAYVLLATGDAPLLAGT